MVYATETFPVKLFESVGDDNFFDSLGLLFSNISNFELMLLIVVNLAVLAYFILRKFILRKHLLKKYASQNTTTMASLPVEENFHTRSGSLRTFFGIEVGTVLQVSEPIACDSSSSRIKYRGLYWRVKSTEPICPGETVKIIGRDVLTLLVEKCSRPVTDPFPVFSTGSNRQLAVE